MLSPVTIRTVMPARWHFLIASGTWMKAETQRKCVLFLPATGDITIKAQLSSTFVLIQSNYFTGEVISKTVNCGTTISHFSCEQPCAILHISVWKFIKLVGIPIWLKVNLVHVIKFSLPVSIKETILTQLPADNVYVLLVATNLGSHRVFNAHHTDTGQSSEDIILIVPIRLTLRGREISVSKADGPQALRGHGLNNFLSHVISVPWAEHLGLTICCQNFIAPERKEGGILIWKCGDRRDKFRRAKSSEGEMHCKLWNRKVWMNRTPKREYIRWGRGVKWMWMGSCGSEKSH